MTRAVAGTLGMTRAVAGTLGMTEAAACPLGMTRAVAGTLGMMDRVTLVMLRAVAASRRGVWLPSGQPGQAAVC
jgi:hypothetical protein